MCSHIVAPRETERRAGAAPVPEPAKLAKARGRKAGRGKRTARASGAAGRKTGKALIAPAAKPAPMEAPLPPALINYRLAAKREGGWGAAGGGGRVLRPQRRRPGEHCTAAGRRAGGDRKPSDGLDIFAGIRYTVGC